MMDDVRCSSSREEIRKFKWDMESWFSREKVVQESAAAAAAAAVAQNRVSSSDTVGIHPYNDAPKCELPPEERTLR